MKKITFILIASLLVLSSCTLFDLQSRAKHAHLNKVRVNDPVLMNTPDEQALIDQEKRAVPIIETEAVTVAPVSDIALITPERSLKSPFVFRQVEKKISARNLNTAFKAQVNSKPASDEQSVDPITLLIWILVIAVILALLSYLLPGLLALFIGLLIVALLILAIIYLAEAM